MMKNIYILIICMILCVSCVCFKRGKCQVNYSVVYPDTTITYDTIFYYAYDTESESKNTHIPYVSSCRGTNYIKLGIGFYNSTTCPIRINSYKTISKNDN